MQRISYRYKSPLSSEIFNERFSYIFGNSILAGFRFAVSPGGFSIDLNMENFETNLLVTREGVIIEEDEDILNAVSFTPNTAEVDRWDHVYLVYNHEDNESSAAYVSIAGNTTTGNEPAPETDERYMFLGKVRVPALQQPLSNNDLSPVNVGLSRVEAANEAIFRDGAIVHGMADFFDEVVFRSNVTFLEKIISEVESQFDANILIPLEPAKDANAASKYYVDSVATGLSPKRPVRATTTTGITLYGEITVDGVSLAEGDRVLVKDQSSMTENGIYDVRVEDWIRSDDADENAEVYSGIHAFVQEGTRYKDSAWVLITDGEVTLGETPLDFVQYGGAGESIAGEGLTKDGNELSAVPATTTTLGSFIRGDGVVVSGGGVLSVRLGSGLQYSGTTPDRSVDVKFLPSSTENGSMTTAARSDHLHDNRYYTKAESDGQFWREDETERLIQEQNKFDTEASLYESFQKYYRRVDHKRSDGTLYMRSTLSNINTDGYAQTLRIDYYDKNGSTIIETKVWNLVYDAHGQIIEKTQTS